MHLKMNKLQKKNANTLIYDMKSCDNSHELEIMQAQIRKFKQDFSLCLVCTLLVE